MKQHITPQDLDQLTPAGKEKLRAWWKPNVGDFYIDRVYVPHKDVGEFLVVEEGEGYHNEIDELLAEKEIEPDETLPLLSIGQMIQYLKDTNNIWSSPYDGGFLCYSEEFGWSVDCGDSKKELCDALWSAVVELLNKE